MSAYRLKADFKIGFRATNVCSAFALRRYLEMPTAKELAERVGFEPTVRITAQRLSSSKIVMLPRAAL